MSDKKRARLESYVQTRDAILYGLELPFPVNMDAVAMLERELVCCVARLIKRNLASDIRRTRPPQGTGDTKMNADELIEKAERETGTRATDSGSGAEAMLMGALARMMGQTNHQERDNFVAGVLLQNSEEIKRRDNAKQAQAALFLASRGIDLD